MIGTFEPIINRLFWPVLRPNKALTYKAASAMLTHSTFLTNDTKEFFDDRVPCYAAP